MLLTAERLRNQSVILGGRLLKGDRPGIPAGMWVATIAGNLPPLAGFIPRLGQLHKVRGSNAKVAAFAVDNSAQYP
jgi:hypothetical protein